MNLNGQKPKNTKKNRTFEHTNETKTLKKTKLLNTNKYNKKDTATLNINDRNSSNKKSAEIYTL